MADRVDPLLGDQAQGGLQQEQTAGVVRAAIARVRWGAPRRRLALTRALLLHLPRFRVHMYSTSVHGLEGKRQESERADVVVIGGGVVGGAAALALARRGSRVTLLERFGLKTARGSSAGTARIYAPAAYPDESYLEMGLVALRRWREFEHASG